MLRTALLRRLIVCLVSVLLASEAMAQIRTRPVTLVPDAKQPVTLTDIIFGEETIDVTLPAKAGNTLSITLTSRSPQAYFNVLPPGSEEAIFTGSVSGSTFTGPLPADGTYIVRIYQMRAAARRNETANVKLAMSLLTKAPEAAAAPSTQIDSQSASAATPFSYSGELHGISFSVSSPNSAEGNRVTVTPNGLAVVNDAQIIEVDGIVTGADVGDIDIDGSPEIYVYVRAHLDGAPGSLVAFSANKNKSMSQIAVPELTPKQAQGYRGGDEFALVENAIARRFTLHKGDKPTAKLRQLQYKLRRGEASWVLKVDRAIEF